MMNPTLPFRIGFGYDVHCFAPERKLFLGGVEIPHHRGLLGHSDADVVLHAIADALLGAAALRDIGHHFPNTDPAYHNIDSKILLRHVRDLILQHGYRIGNIDCTICAEAPKINPYVPTMQNTIAEALACNPTQVSIKATTNEGMGFVGREEGIAAYAVALIYTNN